MELVYDLTDAARQRIFVETGRDPGTEQRLEVDPTQLMREDRALLAELNPQLRDVVRLTLPEWSVLDEPASRRLVLETIINDPAELLAVYRDARQAAQATFEASRDAAAQKRLTAYEEHDGRYRPAELDSYDRRRRFAGSPHLPALEAAYAAALERWREHERQVAEERRRDQERREAEKQQRLEERRAWIAEHGSAYLRKCEHAGYDCQRRYVLERAALEFPGYVVDFDDNARWKDRSGPSEAALDEAARVGGIVVWLTRSPVDDGNPEEYQAGWDDEREAVVIRQYLGRYDLIKIF